MVAGKAVKRRKHVKPLTRIRLTLVANKPMMTPTFYIAGNSRVPVEGPGELAQALDDFDERMVMEPLAYSELRTRPSLEERLESIISGAALMADSSCTRDERRERIVAECNAVRQALQDLLHEYMSNVSACVKTRPSS
ncbi:jg22530 [Pararge aegeria aegeria]|uniref:Jg22530 protein n=1 Tax=Pararge aegeria aegeria TaxID=348720 RepID=A0A8S4QW85_9NEOP|nr:jg22530 [Pararge aegeria aegeria]